MAAVPTELSFIQPTITCMFSARLRDHPAGGRDAAALVSLMLMP